MLKKFATDARFLVAAWGVIGLVAGFAPASFAADAGAIQNVTGNVTITNEENITRKASVKEAIKPGDTVSTEAKSETLIKMADNTTIVLRPNTQFKFTEYRFDKKPTDSSILTVLRGTARLVTGLIGRNNTANFRVGTPTATIGIRGTDFEVAVLPEDTADARAGVYNYVRDGSTNIQLASGQNVNVAKSQTAFAPSNPKPGEEALQILRERPIFLQQGGGLDAIIQSIIIQVPVFR